MHRFPVFALVVLGLALAAPSALADDRPTLDDVVRAYEAGDDKTVVENVELALDGKKYGKLKTARFKYLAAEAHLRLGAHDDAASTFHEVLELRPKAVPALIGLGLAELGRNETDAAREALDRATELDKKNPEVHLALGALETRLGEFARAHEYLKKARARLPKDARVARALVELHLRSDEGDAARTVATAFAKAQPRHPMGPFLKALVLDHAGEGDAAITAYEESISIDDKFIDAHKNLAILCHTDNPTYTDIERTKKSLRHYEKYFELGGRDPQLKRYYETTKQFVEQLLRADQRGNAYFREKPSSAVQAGLLFAEGIVTADVDQIDRLIHWPSYHAWSKANSEDEIPADEAEFRKKVLAGYKTRLKPMGPKPLLHPMLLKMKNDVGEKANDDGTVRIVYPDRIRGLNVAVKQIGDDWYVVRTW